MLSFKNLSHIEGSRQINVDIIYTCPATRLVSAVCVLQSGIGHCCKVSTLCNLQLYGWLDVPANVDALIAFLKANDAFENWGIKEVLIFSAPETESMTQALLTHKSVSKAWEFPRYLAPSQYDTARNSIIVYSLRIS